MTATTTPKPKRKATPKPKRGAPPKFYPTIDDFLEYTLSRKPNSKGSYYGVTAHEGFLMALLWRWQLEDENASQEQMDEVNADLATLNDELGDVGRTAVIQQLVAWASKGDSWLYQRIQTLANSKSPSELG